MKSSRSDNVPEISAESPPILESTDNLLNAKAGIRPSILGLNAAALEAQVTGMGMPKFRAAQILEWIYRKRATSFSQMSNLSIADRAALELKFSIFTGETLRHLTAADGTQKCLIRWPDGGLTESVMIPCDEDAVDESGNVNLKIRRTACLSTQVGCPVGCAFCASGLAGFKNNLQTSQVVEQALRLTHLLPADGRLSNVVFMGMGEPLANLDVTLSAIGILMAPWAFHIGGRKITVSTVGLPPQIRKLADAGVPVTLALSLHAPNDELRRRIIPWAKGIGIDQLVQACAYYFQTTGREITLEYIMLDGVNTLPQHADELASVARRMRANINLIYYNEVPDLPFRRPSGPTMFDFQSQIRRHGVKVHIRKSRGRDIAAACGQLARQDIDGKPADGKTGPA